MADRWWKDKLRGCQAGKLVKKLRDWVVSLPKKLLVTFWGHTTTTGAREVSSLVKLLPVVVSTGVGVWSVVVPTVVKLLQ